MTVLDPAAVAAVVGGVVEGTAVGNRARRRRIARKMTAKPGKGSGSRSPQVPLALEGELESFCCC